MPRPFRAASVRAAGPSSSSGWRRFWPTIATPCTGCFIGGALFRGRLLGAQVLARFVRKAPYFPSAGVFEAVVSAPIAGRSCRAVQTNGS